MLIRIKAYRVSQKSASAVGPQTAYMQQYRALQSNILQQNNSNSSQTPNPNR